MHNVYIKIENNFVNYYNKKYNIRYAEIKTYFKNIFNNIRFPMTDFSIDMDRMAFPISTLNFLFYKN